MSLDIAIFLAGNFACKENIVELSFKSADARVRAIGGTSAEQLSSFVTWLGSQQYSVGYVCIVARHALAFSRWCEGRGIELDALADAGIERYQRNRAQRRSRCAETRRQERQALTLLLHFLREQGICAAAAARATAVDSVAADFAQHLRRNLALAPITVKGYTRLAGQFLAWRFGQGEVCLHDLRPTDAIAFVRHESKRLAPPALKGVTNALRSFLRFGEFRGEITAGLAAGVPSVATWTTTPPIPRAIAAEHAQRAIDSCDRLTAIGRRDHAVLLLLARLGLRACEIIKLALDDIDWDQGQLRVRGKGGRESLLPLPVDVGAAIAAYLEHGRPTCEDRHLFFRSMAPIRGLMEGSDSVGSIVRYALERAKVDAPHRGSHQFRHALAVRMLRQGASLPEIGQVLRHRSPQSTSIYAKVDLDALRTLVMAWPGGAR
jgi:site-specific recombinase XerD